MSLPLMTELLPIDASGIYVITCTATGKVYVGSAISMRHRWAGHINELMREKHANALLQRAWKKYGPSAFVFAVQEYAAKERLIEREQAAIDHYQACDKKHGYNIAPRAGSTLGKPCGPRTRQKIRQALVGFRHSDETKKRLSESHRGQKYQPMSLEARQHISLARSGCKMNLSEEQKRTLRERFERVRYDWTGRHPTEETRAKLRAAIRGRKPALGMKHSEATKARISAVHKGKPKSPEHAARIASALRGKPKTPQHRLHQGIAEARFSAEQIMEMKTLRQQGLFMRQIAERFGCCKQTICNILHDVQLAYKEVQYDAIRSIG